MAAPLMAVVIRPIPTNSMRKIVNTTDTNSGSPRIEGTRLTCANVTQSLWHGYDHSLNAYLATYDYLSRADILNCLSYCARQQCVDDNVHSYCEQCTLDKRPEDAQLARTYDEFKADETDVHETEDIWRLAQRLVTRFDNDSAGSHAENVE